MYKYYVGIIFSFGYAILTLYSTFKTSKKKMLKIQTLDQVFAFFLMFF